MTIDEKIKLSFQSLHANAEENRRNKQGEQESLKDAMEKGDLPAMLFSAFVTIGGSIILLLLLICGIAYLFFAL